MGGPSLSTRTTTAGMIRPKIINSRTSHLLPEIHLRSKRMLQQASKEAVAANSSVVKDLVEIWKAKTNGPTCSCTKKSSEAEIERTSSNDSYLDLKEFLVTNKIRPAKTTESCPICYGTGYIGGYNLQGTDTLVLDATLSPKMSEASIIKERPYWIRTNKSSVSWVITIPKYIEDIYGVVIKWKNEPTAWELFVDDEPISREALLLKAGNRVTITLKTKDTSTEDAGLYGIFMHFTIADVLINVDSPNWTKSYSGSLKVWGEIQDNITANFDSRVQKLTTQDIFIFREGFIYRIVEIQENNPLGVIITWNCQANLVRPSAWYYQVTSKLILSTYKLDNLSFVI